MQCKCGGALNRDLKKLLKDAFQIYASSKIFGYARKFRKLAISRLLSELEDHV